jgi:hypothetical protein
LPRLPQNVLDCVFYLYRDRASAERGEGFGGTGFLVTESVPGANFIYGITNWHVAVRDGFSVMRVNTRDGRADIIEFCPEDWLFIPHGDDIAISPSLNLDNHRISVIRRLDFMPPSPLSRHRDIGVGDDVVMIGRFVDHDGGQTNHPAARFGNISVMPTPVQQPTGAVCDTYVIDMHSRTGYSGSPVFVYRAPGNNLAQSQGPIWPSPQEALKRYFADGFFRLLGVHWGQFPEEWEITEKKRKADGESFIVAGNVVTGLSGMTLVVPAERILDLLDLPELKMPREKANKEFMDRGGRASPVAESASKPADVDAKRDEMLRTMLSMPHQPRKPCGPKKVSST